MRRDAFEFRRAVVLGGEDVETGGTKGEVLLQHLQHRIKKRQQQQQLLQHKISKLKKQHRQQMGVFRSSSSSSSAEGLQRIDFDQLQIENEQFAAQVESSKADIANKKKKCSVLLQAQAVLKEQLSRCLEEGLALEASLNSRKAALEKTKRETEETAAEKEAVKRETKRLLVQSRGCSQLPQVKDLVLQKFLLLKQTKKLNALRRKLEVAQLETKTVKQDLKFQGVNPKPQTLSPKLQTLYPKAQTLKRDFTHAP